MVYEHAGSMAKVTPGCCRLWEGKPGCMREILASIDFEMSISSTFEEWSMVYNLHLNFDKVKGETSDLLFGWYCERDRLIVHGHMMGKWCQLFAEKIKKERHAAEE